MHGFEKTEDCMVDLVESEPFSTSEFRQQTQFRSKLVHSPIAVLRKEWVDERIGDLSLVAQMSKFGHWAIA